VNQDERATFDRALRRARLSAYPTGEFVEQESFMGATEILGLARRAGIAAGVSVLDLCCGVAGPGRLITRDFECDYVGVDLSAGALAIARERAAGLRCRFERARVPPVPDGRFDVVLLLETMLAFADKETLLRSVAGALPAGGRFAFTLEEGAPLTAAEREQMPDADTVWLTPLSEIRALLARAGLQLRWESEHSGAHRAVADALIAAFTADADAITAQIGQQALDDLIDSHRLWSEWLGSGRVRKFAVVAERAQAG